MTETPGWGGRRLGTPGQAYPNRTDLMANPQRAQNGAGGGGAPVPEQMGLTPPDATPSLTDPTTDGRPITDGMDLGPGLSSLALVVPPKLPTDKTDAMLQLLYEQTGSDYIRRLMVRKEGMTRAQIRRPL